MSPPTGPPPGAATTSVPRRPPPRPLTSLRDYVQALDALGEIQRVDAEVSLNLEVGAVIRRSYELRAPAPLFSRIAEAPGFRILGAPAGASAQPGLFLSRVATSLALDPRTDGRAIVEALATARTLPGVPPTVVETGPCKENILLHDAVDLTRLPAPLLHGGDGGRYLNTYGTIVVRSPDGRWTNWSIARIMVLDARRMTGIVAPSQHVGRIHAMWAEQGQDTPFALALGVDPAIPFVSGMPLPDRVDEADYVGAYLGRPVDVVACETNGLHVPASSEIVVEGRLSAHEVAGEGPMGEYAGYQWQGLSTDKPVYHVDAVTHRHDAILLVAVAGEPIEEDHTAWGIPNAAEVLHALRAEGFPVSMAWLTLEAANHWLVITVPADWRRLTGCTSSALCQRVGDIVFGSKHGSGLGKILLMEDDVDATNLDEVVWAFATRCHPGSGEHVFDRRANAALAVYLADDEKRTMTATKAVYDCLTRDEWTGGHRPSRTSLRRGYPPEVVETVLARWNADYGYG